jgi:hypothetical protein
MCPRTRPAETGQRTERLSWILNREGAVPWWCVFVVKWPNYTRSSRKTGNLLRATAGACGQHSGAAKEIGLESEAAQRARTGSGSFCEQEQGPHQERMIRSTVWCASSMCCKARYCRPLVRASSSSLSISWWALSSSSRALRKRSARLRWASMGG